MTGAEVSYFSHQIETESVKLQTKLVIISPLKRLRLLGEDIHTPVKKILRAPKISSVDQQLQKFPVIGKILEVAEEVVNVHYWKGSWLKEWTPHMLPDKTPWTDWLPKACVILVASKANKDFLKKKHRELKANENLPDKQLTKYSTGTAYFSLFFFQFEI